MAPGHPTLGIREDFPEEVPSEQSPGGESQSKRRMTAFQVEGKEALPPLRGLQATLGRARASVNAVGLRTTGADGAAEPGQGAWYDRPEVSSWSQFWHSIRRLGREVRTMV